MGYSRLREKTEGFLEELFYKEENGMAEWCGFQREGFEGLFYFYPWYRAKGLELVSRREKLLLKKQKRFTS